MTQTYCLSPGVHTCCTGEFCVFLDLQRDKYISVNTNDLSRVAPCIRGINASRGPFPAAAAALDPASAIFLDDLCAAQLIIHTSPDNSPSKGAAIPDPRDDLTSVRSPDQQPQGVAHLLQLTKALCNAHFQLSHRPISQIVANVERRKRQRIVATKDDDMQQTLTLAYHFSRYRFLYPKDYLCMLDSLALLLYLASYNLYPMWVFGVREAPFFAHCWVQAGTTVLSDYRDKVIPYTPIMVI